MLVENGPSGASRKQPFRQHLDAGEHERRDALRLPPAELAGAAHVEVALPAMIERPRLRHQQQQGIHALIVPVRSEQLDRVDRPVDPQIVAVDREERIAIDQRRGLDQSAAGFEQQVALIRNGDVEAMRVASRKCASIWSGR